MYRLLGLIHFTDISTWHWRFHPSDKNILLPRTTIRVSALSHLKQCILSISPFRLNEAFEYQLFPGMSHMELCFLCSPPLPCKIYEKCPGAHEMLPHLILCDRITTVSVPLQKLIQDRVHWSFREGERRKREGVWRKKGRRGDGVRGGEKMRISLHSGPQTRAARLIEVNGND